MAPTLKDVAEKAGVSRSAVSRSFTEGASVSPAMRERVLAAAGELGYQPSILASGLSTGRTKLVGLVSNNFQNPFFLEIFDLFTQELQTRGLRPLLVNLTDSREPEASASMLRQYSVDGVVVASSTLPPDFSTAFADLGIPVVHAFARHLKRPDVDTVGVDNVEVGKLAAREFIARGYRRVGFLGGPDWATSSIDRQRGFAETLNAHGSISFETHFSQNYAFDAGRDAMAQILDRGDPAEAYFCGDDVVSIGAMSILRERGFDIPGKVGLLGVNDMEMARWQNIALTTIRQPVHDIVVAVAERLLTLMQKPDDPVRAIRLEPLLIERKTLGPRL
jgi:DNA-binding LacI/PurR family transcriptional regulator